MNLKKLVLGFTLTAFLAAPAFSATANSSAKTLMSQYKAKNYVGCLQTTQRILEKDPSDGYALYYQALAYYQLGKKDKAMESFDKVILINGNAELVKQASKAKACSTSPEECAKFNETVDEFDKFVNSNKFYTEKVQSQINQKKLDKIRQDFNESTLEESGAKKSQEPTNEEIANAVRTLAKVGFNPMNTMGMYQSPEMVQMNMLLGDNNSNLNNMNMWPYMMMSQNQNGTNNLSPELMQTMMMSQMHLY